MWLEISEAFSYLPWKLILLFVLVWAPVVGISIIAIGRHYDGHWFWQKKYVPKNKRRK